MFGFHCCKSRLLTHTIYLDPWSFAARLFSISWHLACTVGVVSYQALDFVFAVAKLHKVSMSSLLQAAEIPFSRSPTSLDRLKTVRVCSLSSFRLLMKMIVKFKNVMWFRKTFQCDKKQCWKQEKIARAESCELSCGKGFVSSPHRKAQVLSLELLSKGV